MSRTQPVSQRPDPQPEPPAKADEILAKADETLDAPDYLTCPFCREMLHKPVILRCGHTFCGDCLPRTDTSRCSVCNQPTQSAVRTNYLADRLIAEHYPDLRRRREEIHDERTKIDGKYQEWRESIRYHFIHSNLLSFIRSHCLASISRATRKFLERGFLTEEIENCIVDIFKSNAKFKIAGKWMINTDHAGDGVMCDWLAKKPSSARFKRAFVVCASAAHFRDRPSDQFAQFSGQLGIDLGRKPAGLYRVFSERPAWVLTINDVNSLPEKLVDPKGKFFQEYETYVQTYAQAYVESSSSEELSDDEALSDDA